MFQLVVSDGRLTNKASTSVTLNVPDPNNQAPIAQIAAPVTAEAGSMVELDGTASKDADGDSITYAWTQTQPAALGPESPLGTADQPKTIFAAPLVTADTVYAFRLVVSDAKGGMSYAERSLTVHALSLKRPPVANAGWNQNAAAKHDRIGRYEPL